MKNLTKTMHTECAPELQASKAIQRIQKWVEEHYPRLASVAKSRLIIECLIELTEEKKLLAEG